MKLNTTPGLYNPEPAPPKEKTLEQLRDEYADYRDDCNKHYCQRDPAVIAEFEAAIAAKEQHENPDPTQRG